MANAAPTNETKEAKSLRLGRARVLAALEKIELVGNLAGPNYVFTPEQVAKMAEAMLGSVRTAIDKLNKVEGVEGFAF